MQRKTETWYHYRSRPSQYQGITGDMQPALPQRRRLSPHPGHPSDSHVPFPAARTLSPLYLQQQKEHQRAKAAQKRRFYVTILLVCSLVFSGTALLLQWGNVSYHSVSAASEEGKLALEEAKDALARRDLATAVVAFSDAEEHFSDARKTLAPLAKVPVDNPVRSAYHLLDAGARLSLAGEKTCIGMGPVLDLALNREGEYANLTAGGFMKEVMIAFVAAEPLLNEANTLVGKAEQDIAQVRLEDFSPEQQETIAQLQESIPIVREIVQIGYELSQFLPDLLGNYGKRSYMIIFQNSWERRPTGGFIGGFSVLELEDAQIQGLYTKNVYDIEGQLKEYAEPPEPIQVGFPDHDLNWGMRDSNWDPDFPTSAVMTNWFYRRAAEESVNGFVAVDPTFIQYILKLLGPLPISFKGQEIIVTADNFVHVIEEQERAIDEGGDPREFLINLSKVVFDHLLEVPKDKWTQLLGVIKAGLDEKHLLLYFQDPRAQEVIVRNNWGGHVTDIPDGTDYFMLNDANINGSKSCLLVQQEITIQVAIDAQGRIRNKATIVYQHTGTHVWPSSPVHYYTRTYVPEGSRLLSATGDKTSLTEITSAHHKTVFADYLMIEPGTTKSLSYTYELPFTLPDDDIAAYKLSIQKQPGTIAHKLRFSLQPTAPFAPVSSPRKITITSDNEAWFMDELRTDEYVEILLKR